MSKIYADTVEPTVPAKDITLGATGDSITISGNSINTNVIKDSGGNVLFQSDGSGTLSNVNSAFSADLKLISTQTASKAASVIISGLDSTYDLYIIKIIELNPATDIAYFRWQATTDGSNYNTVCTSTAFRAYHKEDDSQSGVHYLTGSDAAQSTADIELIASVANDADANSSGEIHLFNPSSTTYVKHWYSRFSGYDHDDVSIDNFYAGYFNTTSAITGVKFVMNSGNLDGVFKLYGL